MSMKINSRCRECEGADLVRFLDLGAQPLANSFLTSAQLNQPEPRYPLEAYVCSRCQLAQLIHIVDPSEVFSSYVYFSSAMPKVSARWRAYADEVSHRFLEAAEDLVLEIGSNDGVLLRHFREVGHRVLGVDPARNIADVAMSRGIPTLTEFFTASLASEICDQHGRAKAVLANNVFAHIDDHLDLLQGVRTLLHPDGVFVVEAPYLMDMFANLSYDTIYHEHLSFLSLRPLVRCFARYGLEIFAVHLIESQGQSIRLFAGHRGRHSIEASVQRLIDRELSARLDRVETYFDLADRVAASRDHLVSLLAGLKSNGKRIAAYGAPAKGNTVLNYCRIGTDVLDFAVDDLPSKQGLFTPGMHVPVTSRAEVDRATPDCLLLLAWNYRAAIMEKERAFLSRGGEFIMPIGAPDDSLRRRV
jgi:SAM-dependent methyltransferase